MASITPILSALDIDKQPPGDGVCLFFYDANYEMFPAGIGSALGYTNYVGEAAIGSLGQTTRINGIRGAYVGVGFDVKGNFSTTLDGKIGSTVSAVLLPDSFPYTGVVTTCAEPDPNPNTLCVRSSELSSYKILNTSDDLSTYPVDGSSTYNVSPPVTLHQTVTSRDDVTFHKVRVTLQNNSKRLRVDIKNNKDNTYYPYQIIDLDGTNIPEKLRVGLAFATSKSTTNCEIKNFSVQGGAVDYAKTIATLVPLTSAAFIASVSAC